MLTILFKILGILGILLLVLLGIALTVILLVLFFPLCYKASGQKSADEMRFSVKVIRSGANLLQLSAAGKASGKDPFFYRI